MRTRSLSALVLLAACNRPTTETPAIRAEPSASTSASASSAPTPVVTAAPSAGPCAKDADCRFDDPCMPAACVLGAAKPATCEESAPRPGTCACVEGVCALRRKVAATGAKKTGCTTGRACVFVPATGSCAEGAGPPTVEAGGACACVAGTCTPEWVEPVPCTSSADCSWRDDPHRPVSSKVVPRPTGKPCAGYSRSAECRDGLCRVAVWKC